MVVVEESAKACLPPGQGRVEEMKKKKEEEEEVLVKAESLAGTGTHREAGPRPAEAHSAWDTGRYTGGIYLRRSWVQKPSGRVWRATEL